MTGSGPVDIWSLGNVVEDFGGLLENQPNPRARILQPSVQCRRQGPPRPFLECICPPGMLKPDGLEVGGAETGGSNANWFVNQKKCVPEEQQ